MIFISYSHIDLTRAQRLRTRLEGDGIPCWMAPRDIPAGKDYATEIPLALANCSAFLLLLTANSQRSIWVPKELDTAINNGKPIVPYILDKAPLNPAFSFKLVNVQCISSVGRSEESYEELRSTLLSFLPVQEAKPALVSSQPTAMTEAVKWGLLATMAPYTIAPLGIYHASRWLGRKLKSALASEDDGNDQDERP